MQATGWPSTTVSHAAGQGSEAGTGAAWAPSESELVDALVPSRDELDGVLAEGEVVGEASRDRRQGEVLRGQKSFTPLVSRRSSRCQKSTYPAKVPKRSKKSW